MLLYYKLSWSADTVWIELLVAVEDNDEFVYTSKIFISATRGICGQMGGGQIFWNKAMIHIRTTRGSQLKIY